MMSPLDTRITFFGGANNELAIDAVVKLADAGYDIVIADHDPRESVPFKDMGIEFVRNRVEAVEGAQVVITSLASCDDVEELYLGENGLLELLDAGTYVIDLSASTPNLARELHAVAAISDIQVVDAPLVAYGDDEKVLSFVGGDPETQKTVSPLFPYMADKIIPQSGPGEGQLAAMLATISLAGSLMGAIEALSIARVSEYDLNKALGVLASTSAGSRTLVEYAPRVMVSDFSGRIKVSTFLMSLAAALRTANELEVTAPLVETAYQLYDLLTVVGGESLNIQALALLYADEQTCADHGLDWALAESALAGDFPPDSEFGDMFSMGGSAGFGSSGLGNAGLGNSSDEEDGLSLGDFFSRN